MDWPYYNFYTHGLLRRGVPSMPLKRQKQWSMSYLVFLKVCPGRRLCVSVKAGTAAYQRWLHSVRRVYSNKAAFQRPVRPFDSISFNSMPPSANGRQWEAMVAIGGTVGERSSPTLTRASALSRRAAGGRATSSLSGLRPLACLGPSFCHRRTRRSLELVPPLNWLQHSITEQFLGHRIFFKDRRTLRTALQSGISGIKSARIRNDHQKKFTVRN
jgi:hypothetical protein